jgi:hypothetical protein
MIHLCIKNSLSLRYSLLALYSTQHHFWCSNSLLRWCIMNSIELIKMKLCTVSALNIEISNLFHTLHNDSDTYYVVSVYDIDIS